MREQAIALVRRWFQSVWNDRQVALIDEVLSPTSLCHTDHGPVVGPDDFREKMFAPFIAAFPDLRVNVEDVIAEGDQVVVRWNGRGTHTGSAMGLEASGKPVEFHGITWIRTDGTTFKEGWQWSDIPQVLSRLNS